MRTRVRLNNVIITAGLISVLIADVAWSQEKGIIALRSDSQPTTLPDPFPARNDLDESNYVVSPTQVHGLQLQRQERISLYVTLAPDGGSVVELQPQRDLGPVSEDHTLRALMLEALDQGATIVLDPATAHYNDLHSEQRSLARASLDRANWSRDIEEVRQMIENNDVSIVLDPHRQASGVVDSPGKRGLAMAQEARLHALIREELGHNRGGDLVIVCCQ